MNRTSAWALIGVALVAMLVLLAAVRLYFPAGLLPATIVLYALAIVMLLIILRVSKRKQAG